MLADQRTPKNTSREQSKPMKTTGRIVDDVLEKHCEAGMKPQGSENKSAGKDGSQKGRQKSPQKKRATFQCGTPFKYGFTKQKGHDYWNDLLYPLQMNDKGRCDSWRDEVQNILIFASLFSAVVTAFIVESYKDLKSDPIEKAVELLSLIAARLDTANPLPTPFGTDPFLAPSSSSIRVNIFWILSLVLSLTTVLIGIVASQWLREHQMFPQHLSTDERFALLNMRTEMLDKWHVSTFFTVLPIMLELALVLFFLGLVDFLQSLGVQKVTIPITIAISFSLAFLLATTAIPALQVVGHLSVWRSPGNRIPTPCPYKSPQSQIFRLGLQFIAQKFRTLKDISTLNTPLWADLDLKWISYRRCSHASEPYWTDGGFQRAAKYGPLYDHLLGLQRIYKQYSHLATLLEASYHCFLDCVSTEEIGQDRIALHRPARDEDVRYYNSVMSLFHPTPHLPIVSEVMKEPHLCLLLEEALFRFAYTNRPSSAQIWNDIFLPMVLELGYRLRHYLYDNGHNASSGPPKQLQIVTDIMASLEYGKTLFSEAEVEGKISSISRENGPFIESLLDLRLREKQYLESVLRCTADANTNWSVYQLFSPDDLASLITSHCVHQRSDSLLRETIRALIPYLEDLIHLSTPHLTDARLSASPWASLNDHDLSLERPLQDPDISRQAHSLAWAIVILDAYGFPLSQASRNPGIFDTIPGEIWELVVVCKEINKSLVSCGSIPRVRTVLEIMKTMCGVTARHISNELANSWWARAQERVKEIRRSPEPNEPVATGERRSSTLDLNDVAEDVQYLPQAPCAPAGTTSVL